MEFESGNLYSSLMKFDVNQVEKEHHGAIAFLNRTFFNVNPNKQGKAAFGFGTSNMLTSDAIERISQQSAQDFKPLGNILTFDVETTGVTKGSQVRSWAGKVTNAAGESIDNGEFKAAFENVQMANARIVANGETVSLSRGVNILEGATNVKSMENGGAEFITEAKSLFKRILSDDIQHLSGHNVLFDLHQMTQTIQALPAYDEEMKKLQYSVYDRIAGTGDYAGKNNFLIDTRESFTSYFAKKAEEQGIQTSEKARALLSPEMLGKIERGGSTTPSSIQNIVANSNILDLIEKDAANGNRDAAKLMQRIQGGAHIAETDVHMQATLQRHQLQGTLDFAERDSFGRVVESSAFTAMGRKKYLSSSALTATTNVADVAHMEQAARDYLADAGAKHVELSNITAAEIGLERSKTGQFVSQTAKGSLSYNKEAGAFQFNYINAKGVDKTAIIGDEAVARNAIASRIRGVSTSADNISIRGFSNLDATQVAQAAMARAATEGVAAESNKELITRSLALTDEQFGIAPSYKSIFGEFGNTTRGQTTKDLQPVLNMGDDIIKKYHMNAARAGLGFSSLNVQDRVLSVKLSQATSGIAKSAASGVDVGRSMAHARHADILGEMGLSFFNTQQETRLIGRFDETGAKPASKVLANFESIFNYSEAADSSGNIVKSLKVKPFGDANILEGNLNAFTLSYVSDSELSSQAGARINVVWGANGEFSKEQSELLASHLLETNHEEALRLAEIHGMEKVNSMTLTELAGAGAKGSAERIKLVEEVATQIRQKGIAIATAEGDVAKQIIEAYKKAGFSQIENDTEMLNHVMRLVHSENGVATFGATRNMKTQEAMGMTAREAQAEANQALESARSMGEAFEGNRGLLSKAKQVVAQGRRSKTLTTEVDLTQKAASDFKTPMTDFFLKNKSNIGYAAIGLAAVGAGYYMSKKHRESEMYDETVRAQPTEPGHRRSTLQNQMAAKTPQSTRRDPLVTAGVVGNLDRNKIGHTQMGPNKYNHLYGG